MQGLALVGGRPLVGVTSLDALAHAASADLRPGTMVGVWMDAHRGDVFAALYRVTDAPPFDPARLAAIEPATVGDPRATIARWRGSDVAVIAGDGAVLFADVIAAHAPGARVAAAPLTAGAIAKLARARLRTGAAAHPAAIQPFYVRRPDAEVDRDRRALRDTGKTPTHETSGRSSGSA